MPDIRKSIESRKFGILLAIIHGIWFCVVVSALGHHPHAAISFLSDGSSTETLFAGKPFHFEYESAFLKVLFFLDFPALLVCRLFNYVFSLVRLQVSAYALSYIDAALLLCFGCLQWLILGRSIAARFWKLRRDA
jgi:hypothetical protein